MTAGVVVAGDVHLGSAHADVAAFNGFLEELYASRNTLTELILLGDVWDLVRRDPFGCAWETSETISRLQRLGASVPVRILLGNHDTYLRGLDDSLYDVEFSDDYVLEQNGQRIRFSHGHAFDTLQFDAVSEYLSGPGDRGDIDPTRGRKDPVLATARAYLGQSVARLRSLATDGAADDSASRTYSRRERRAHAYLDSIPATKLIYGHTHAPYVHHDNVAANPGSWKETAPVHNTYLRVEDGDIRLFRYRPDGDDERIRSLPDSRTSH